MIENMHIYVTPPRDDDATMTPPLCNKGFDHFPFIESPGASYLAKGVSQGDASVHYHQDIVRATIHQGPEDIGSLKNISHSPDQGVESLQGTIKNMHITTDHVAGTTPMKSVEVTAINNTA